MKKREEWIMLSYIMGTPDETISLFPAACRISLGQDIPGVSLAHLTGQVTFLSGSWHPYVNLPELPSTAAALSAPSTEATFLAFLGSVSFENFLCLFSFCWVISNFPDEGNPCDCIVFSWLSVFGGLAEARTAS
jgi:hypothetical protein